MRLVEFAEVIVEVSAVVLAVGFVSSAWSAWKFRHEIKRAELRKAAQMIRAERFYTKAQEKLSQDERDEALVGMSHG